MIQLSLNFTKKPVRYPNKKEFLDLVSEKISLDEFLKNHFEKISKLNKEHPVKIFIGNLFFKVIKSNKKEILSGSLNSIDLYNNLLAYLKERSIIRKEQTLTNRIIGEKDRFEEDDVALIEPLGKDFIEKICYAYSEEKLDYN